MTFTVILTYLERVISRCIWLRWTGGRGDNDPILSKVLPWHLSGWEVLLFHKIQLDALLDHGRQESVHEEAVAYKWPQPELYEPAGPSPPRRPPGTTRSQSGYRSHPPLTLLLETGKGRFEFGCRRIGRLFEERVQLVDE